MHILGFGLGRMCGLTALWNAGIRVPDELSVAGFDNIFTTSLAPISITTVDQSGLDMGAAEDAFCWSELVAEARQ